MHIRANHVHLAYMYNRRLRQDNLCYPNIKQVNYCTTESSAGLRWVLLMLQHWTHSRNRPTATDEKKKSLLYFGYDFASWYNFGKIIKTVATRCHIMKHKMHQIQFRLGLRPIPSWGSLQRSPDPLAKFKGAYF